MNDDIFAALRAQADQSVAATINMARLMAAFYNTLIAEGVPGADASEFTLTWLEVNYKVMRPSE